MKKSYLLLLLIPILSISCMRLPSRTKTEGWYWGMGAIVQSYVQTCFKIPQTADDLIQYLELKGGFLDEGRMFQSQYEFLKKYWDKIRITENDGFTAMYFGKKFMGDVNNCFHCENERGLHGYMRFFTPNGFPIVLEASCDHYQKELLSRLLPIGYKNPDKEWLQQKGNLFNDPLILEYTKENGLINFCTKEKIDIQSSLYYNDLYEVLAQFSEEYNFPRIIIDSYIPKN